MDTSCLPNTASYTFNGDHIGGQAVFESVHPPLSGGGRRRARKTARKSTRRSARRNTRRSARRDARRNARRSARRTTRRSARRSARGAQGRRAVYREADKSVISQ